MQSQKGVLVGGMRPHGAPNSEPSTAREDITACEEHVSLSRLTRRALRPWTLRHVASGRWLVACVQRFQNPFLDRLHSLCALSCGIEFYITFLPLLFWVGEVRLARLTTIFMAMTIYVGNAIKDTVCAPRPAPGTSGTAPHGGPHTVRVLKTQSEGVPVTA